MMTSLKLVEIPTILGGFRLFRSYLGLFLLVSIGSPENLRGVTDQYDGEPQDTQAALWLRFQHHERPTRLSLSLQQFALLSSH